jgi:predicted transcriptional regulator
MKTAQLRLFDFLTNYPQKCNQLPAGREAPTVLRVLSCVRDGFGIPKIIEVTRLTRNQVRYALKRLKELNLIDLPNGYPVIPVLLIDFEEAKAIILERLVKKIEIPLDLDKTGVSEKKSGFGVSPPPLIVSAPRLVASGECAGGLIEGGGGVAGVGKAIATASPPLLSMHRVRVRFKLRGRLPVECDRIGKNGRKYWYMRDSAEGGACVEGFKSQVFVSVFGCSGNSVGELLVLASGIARKTVLAWSARYGARVDGQGEVCAGKHFVIEGEALSRELKRILNLEARGPLMVESESGLAKWYADKSHSRKVEVSGVGAEEQVNNLVFVVSGEFVRMFQDFVRKFESGFGGAYESPGRDKELRGYS